MDSRAVGAAFFVLLFAVPAAAQRVVDGDTIDLNGTRWRLWGIDAPEHKQLCKGGWPAGVRATEELKGLIVEHREVTCDAKGRDRYGRTLGVCHAGALDLNWAMVRSGMAWAFTRYSLHYEDAEDEARADDLGVHAHDCMKAWEWRAHKASR